MSDRSAPVQHLYDQYAGTAEWVVLDRALTELAENHDLQESTAHPYIVGYLCEALARKQSLSKPRIRRSSEEIAAIVEAAQAAFRKANPTGRDLVAELSAERREAAERGD